MYLILIVTYIFTSFIFIIIYMTINYACSPSIFVIHGIKLATLV